MSKTGRGNTSRDWLNLLVVPAIFGISAWWFNRQQKQAGRLHAIEQQQGAVLQAYLNQMTELLLKQGLRQPGPALGAPTEAQTVARAHTLAALRALDPEHKGQLVLFLFDAGLIRAKSPVLSLQEADLRQVNLRNAALAGAGLDQANLTEADLRMAQLEGASLAGADLKRAKVAWVILKQANLRRANLAQADLSWAVLQDADLSEANLADANLEKATLVGANLAQADLEDANLKETDLREANLEGANLAGARVTKEQLAQAGSLKDAILPYTF